jgi:MucB/RseB N-terminal domain
MNGFLLTFPSVVILAILAVGTTSIRAHAQQDLSGIIQKSVVANDRDWDADAQYDYYETDREADGTKTYEVTMQYGTPYERLVALNGKELTPSQKNEQQRKFDKEMAQRRAESPRQRAARIAKFKDERKRDHAMLAQLTKAFNFTSQGEQQLGDYKVYVLKATPRPGYRPTSRDTRVLTGMEGTLWIDKQTYQWVEVEAHVIHPVSIIGLLAKVEPGTRFELEKTPVDDNIWLSKHFSMTANAKVLSLVSHHSQEDDTFFNYHKRQSSSTGSSSSNGSRDSSASAK